MKPVKTFDKLAKIVEATEEANPGDINLYDFPSNDNDVSEAVEGRNIGKVTYLNVEFYLEQAYDTQTSFLLYGDPGLGKSVIIRNIAKKIARDQHRDFIDWVKCSLAQKQELIANPEKYFILVDQRAAGWDPTDLQGIPSLSGEKWLEMRPHSWIWLMSLEDSSGMLFLDELNQSSPQVLKSLFQVILDRTACNLPFKDTWGVMAAGNLGDKFNNEILPLALTNRFMVAQLDPDAKAWIKWANVNGIDEGIIAFVEANEDENFYELPEAGQSDPFPSPRQFEVLTKLINYIKKKYWAAKQAGNIGSLPSIYKTVQDNAAQTCGFSWALKFITFLKYQKTFDWATIVKDPHSVFSKADVDKIHALVLITRDAVIKYFGTNSPYKDEPKVQEQFVRDFCVVFGHFNQEFRIVLINRLNNKDRLVAAKFIVFMMKYKNEEPFKTALGYYQEALTIATTK